MNELFAQLSLESEKSLDASSDIKIGQDAFYGCEPEVVQVVKSEKINLNGAKVNVRRVFVRLPQTEDYRNVGWVLCDDVDSCMICNSWFWPFFDKKMHCQICGNIVCEKCLNEVLIIAEFRDFGYVKACSHCYWGQVIQHTCKYFKLS